MRGRGGRGRAGWSAAHAARTARRRRGSGSQRAVAARAPRAPIIVDGVPVGVVIALPRSALRQLGPTLAVVGAVLVVIGTTAAALLIFGPVRPRLRSLEDAARKVGAGDLTARAREDGGDEVAALAQRVQSDDARSPAARGAAAGRRSHAASAARRRLARADDAADRHARLSRNALASRAIARSRNPRALSRRSFETKRSASSTSSAICWICRASKAAANRSMRRTCRSRICSGACSRATAARPKQKGVEIATSIAPGAEIVTGDPMRLEQALQNLAANALRHTPKGGRVALNAAFEDDAHRRDGQRYRIWHRARASAARLRSVL